MAGFLYLLLVLPGPFSLIYLPNKLIVQGDAAATANNVRAHEMLFRFGMVADVAGAVFFILLVMALYRLLRDVNESQAWLMVYLVLVSTAIGCVNVLPNISVDSCRNCSGRTRPQQQTSVRFERRRDSFQSDRI